MKTKAICLLMIAILAGGALGYSDSLRCKLVDWMDARSNHEFLHERSGGFPEGYAYTGCRWWDLDMGDSVLVWLPGSQKLFFVDPYNTTGIDTVYSRISASYDRTACEMSDSSLFAIAGAYYTAFYVQDDTTNYISSNFLPWASFSYLAHEDSFLYTFNREHVTHDTVGIICINVADPENMFIYRWYDCGGVNTGLEVLNGYTYVGNVEAYTYDYDYDQVYSAIGKIDMINSAEPEVVSGGILMWYKFFGDIACDGKSRVYAVNSDLSPWPDWETGESHLYVIETDTSYTFNQRWEGMAVFGVDVISDSLVVAGFEHGFSVLNVADLDSIREVAYYMNEDTTFDFTNFALKGNRMYAMGHWEDDSTWARLWMFELDDSVISAISDLTPQTARPEAFEIYTWPNPFNSAVTIAINAPSVETQNLASLQIEIYDVAGRRIADAEPVEAGAGWLTNNTSTSSVSVFAPLSRGDLGGVFVWRPDPSLPSGVYLVRASIAEQRGFDKLSHRDIDVYSTTKRIVFLK